VNDDVFGLKWISSVEIIDGDLGVNIIEGTQNRDDLDFSNTELFFISYIDGREGNDRITGSSANDTMIGGLGNDSLFGGEGTDTRVREGDGQGADGLDGGDGTDTLQGGVNDDVFGLKWISSVEIIDGGLGVNIIEGTQNRDDLDFSNTELFFISYIDGREGNDRITGSSANDTIIGGPGNDVISGQGGFNTAIYNGELVGYTIVTEDTHITVIDHNPADGDEGIDQLSNIQKLTFDDEEVLIGSPDNTTPIAVDDWTETSENLELQIPDYFLLSNDIDEDGDTLYIDQVTSLYGGTAVHNDGHVTFTPDPNYYGIATFQYSVNDAQSTSGFAVVSIEVSAVNDLPVANNDSVTVENTELITIPVGVILANDSDPDGDSLSILSIESAVNGTVSLEGSASIVFTPSDSWSGGGSFIYTVSDGNTGTDEATVYVRDSNAPGFRILATNRNLGSKRNYGNIVQWDGLTGEYLGELIPNNPSIALNLSGIEVGPDGNLYVLYNGAAKYDEDPSVQVFSVDGFYLGQYASLTGLETTTSTVTTDLEFDNDGNLYVLDRGVGFGNTEVFMIQGPEGDNPGALIEVFLTPDLIMYPWRRLVSFDMETGPDGNLYFASVGSHSLLRFKTPGGEDFGYYGEIFIGSWQKSPSMPLLYLGVYDEYRSFTWDIHPDYPGVRTWGIDWNKNGHLFAVADEVERHPRMMRIIEIDGDGNYIRDFVSADDGYSTEGWDRSNHFREAKFGPDGNFYVVNNNADVADILIFGDPDGSAAGELILQLAPTTDPLILTSIAFVVDLHPGLTP